MALDLEARILDDLGRGDEAIAVRARVPKTHREVRVWQGEQI